MGGERWDARYRRHASVTSPSLERKDVPGPPMMAKVTARCYEVDLRGERDHTARPAVPATPRPRPPGEAHALRPKVTAVERRVDPVTAAPIAAPATVAPPQIARDEPLRSNLEGSPRPRPSRARDPGPFFALVEPSAGEASVSDEEIDILRARGAVCVDRSLVREAKSRRALRDGRAVLRAGLRAVLAVLAVIFRDAGSFAFEISFAVSLAFPGRVERFSLVRFAFPFPAPSFTAFHVARSIARRFIFQG